MIFAGARDIDAPQERAGRIEYLFLTPEGKAAIEVRDNAIDALPPGTRLRCRNPESRVRSDGKTVLYFPHMDYDERTPPDPLTARRMCSTGNKMCPVAVECVAVADATEAQTGVWGGYTYIDGRPVGITNNKEATHG